MWHRDGSGSAHDEIQMVWRAGMPLPTAIGRSLKKSIRDLKADQPDASPHFNDPIAVINDSGH